MMKVTAPKELFLKTPFSFYNSDWLVFVGSGVHVVHGLYLSRPIPSTSIYHHLSMEVLRPVLGGEVSGLLLILPEDRL